MRIIHLALVCLSHLAVMALSETTASGSSADRLEAPTSEPCPPLRAPKFLRAGTNLSLFLTPGMLKGKYAPNQDCHWVLQSSSINHRIQLQIHDSQLEDRLFTNCDDFIEVRDGKLNESPLITRWCGYYNPLSITSSANFLRVRFKTDTALQLRGANMSYLEFPNPGCPPGWVLKRDVCFRQVSPKPPQSKVTWVQAQRHCMYDKSNLLTIVDDKEYKDVWDAFGNSAEEPWIGVTDAQQEGHFQSVDPSIQPGPQPFQKFSEDHGEKDCIYLDYGDSSTTYNLDDCRQKRAFICERRRDGSTVPYPPPNEVIRQGLVATEAAAYPYYLWLLFLAVLIVIFIILIPVCWKKYKDRKRRNQVEALTTSDSGQLLHHSVLENGAVEMKEQNPSVATLPRSASRVLEQKGTTTPDNSNGDSLSKSEPEPETKNAPTTTPEEKSPILTTFPVVHSPPSSPQANGHVVVSRERAPRMGVGGVPPLDRFDRPYVRMLDNISAISLDDFWSKIDSNNVKQVPASRTGSAKDA